MLEAFIRKLDVWNKNVKSKQLECSNFLPRF